MSAGTRVVHMTSAHQALDSRIFYKECRSLAAAGFDVCLVAPGATDETRDGVRIRGVAAGRGRLNRILFTTWRVFAETRRQKPRVCHFHDSELIPVAVILKMLGFRVVYDVHENLPTQIACKTYLGPKPVRYVFAAGAWLVEKVAAFLFDGFCVAAPRIAERFPEDKTVLLRNFVSLEFFDGIEATAPERGTSPTVLIYPGSLTQARGIEALIDAVGLMKGRAELRLMGRWHDRKFRDRCRQSAGWQYTRDLGRQPLERVVEELKSAHIGLHLPLPSPNYTDGLAIKAFEYMACKLPFIATDEPAKRKSFESCALFSDPTRPADIVDNIEALIADPELRIRLGRAGRRLVESRYSWEKEREGMLTLYKGFVAVPGNSESSKMDSGNYAKSGRK